MACQPSQTSPKRCTCCPYGYHIEVDFVDFAQEVNIGHQCLHKIPRYRGLLSKSYNLAGSSVSSTFGLEDSESHLGATAWSEDQTNLNPALSPLSTPIFDFSPQILPPNLPFHSPPAYPSKSSPSATSHSSHEWLYTDFEKHFSILEELYRHLRFDLLRLTWDQHQNLNAPSVEDSIKELSGYFHASQSQTLKKLSSVLQDKCDFTERLRFLLFLLNAMSIYLETFTTASSFLQLLLEQFVVNIQLISRTINMSSFYPSRQYDPLGDIQLQVTNMEDKGCDPIETKPEFTKWSEETQQENVKDEVTITSTTSSMVYTHKNSIKKSVSFDVRCRTELPSTGDLDHSTSSQGTQTVSMTNEDILRDVVVVSESTQHHEEIMFQSVSRMTDFVSSHTEDAPRYCTTSTMTDTDVGELSDHCMCYHFPETSVRIQCHVSCIIKDNNSLGKSETATYVNGKSHREIRSSDKSTRTKRKSVPPIKDESICGYHSVVDVATDPLVDDSITHVDTLIIVDASHDPIDISPRLVNQSSQLSLTTSNFATMTENVFELKDEGQSVTATDFETPKSTHLSSSQTEKVTVSSASSKQKIKTKKKKCGEHFALSVIDSGQECSSNAFLLADAPDSSISLPVHDNLISEEAISIHRATVSYAEHLRKSSSAETQTENQETVNGINFQENRPLHVVCKTYHEVEKKDRANEVDARAQNVLDCMICDASKPTHVTCETHRELKKNDQASEIISQKPEYCCLSVINEEADVMTRGKVVEADVSIFSETCDQGVLQESSPVLATCKTYARIKQKDQGTETDIQVQAYCSTSVINEDERRTFENVSVGYEQPTDVADGSHFHENTPLHSAGKSYFQVKKKNRRIETEPQQKEYHCALVVSENDPPSRTECHMVDNMNFQEKAVAHLACKTYNEIKRVDCSTELSSQAPQYCSILVVSESEPQPSADASVGFEESRSLVHATGKSYYRVKQKDRGTEIVSQQQEYGSVSVCNGKDELYKKDAEVEADILILPETCHRGVLQESSSVIATCKSYVQTQKNDRETEMDTHDQNYCSISVVNEPQAAIDVTVSHCQTCLVVDGNHSDESVPIHIACKSYYQMDKKDANIIDSEHWNESRPAHSACRSSYQIKKKDRECEMKFQPSKICSTHVDYAGDGKLEDLHIADSMTFSESTIPVRACKSYHQTKKKDRATEIVSQQQEYGSVSVCNGNDELYKKDVEVEANILILPQTCDRGILQESSSAIATCKSYVQMDNHNQNYCSISVVSEPQAAVDVAVSHCQTSLIVDGKHSEESVPIHIVCKSFYQMDNKDANIIDSEHWNESRSAHSACRSFYQIKKKDRECEMKFQPGEIFSTHAVHEGDGKLKELHFADSMIFSESTIPISSCKSYQQIKKKDRGTEIECQQREYPSVSIVYESQPRSSADVSISSWCTAGTMENMCFEESSLAHNTGRSHHEIEKKDCEIEAESKAQEYVSMSVVHEEARVLKKDISVGVDIFILPETCDQCILQESIPVVVTCKSSIRIKKKDRETEMDMGKNDCCTEMRIPEQKCCCVWVSSEDTSATEERNIETSDGLHGGIREESISAHVAKVSYLEVSKKMCATAVQTENVEYSSVSVINQNEDNVVADECVSTNAFSSVVTNCISEERTSTRKSGKSYHETAKKDCGTDMENSQHQYCSASVVCEAVDISRQDKCVETNTVVSREIVERIPTYTSCKSYYESTKNDSFIGTDTHLHDYCSVLVVSESDHRASEDVEIVDEMSCAKSQPAFSTCKSYNQVTTKHCEVDMVTLKQEYCSLSVFNDYEPKISVDVSLSSRQTAAIVNNSLDDEIKKDDREIGPECQSRQAYSSVLVVNEEFHQSKEEVEIVDNMICEDRTPSHVNCKSYFQMKKKNRRTETDHQQLEYCSLSVVNECESKTSVDISVTSQQANVTVDMLLFDESRANHLICQSHREIEATDCAVEVQASLCIVKEDIGVETDLAVKTVPLVEKRDREVGQEASPSYKNSKSRYELGKNDFEIEIEPQRQMYCSVLTVNEAEQKSSDAIEIHDNMICEDRAPSHTACQSYHQLRKKDQEIEYGGNQRPAVDNLVYILEQVQPSTAEKCKENRFAYNSCKSYYEIEKNNISVQTKAGLHVISIADNSTSKEGGSPLISGKSYCEVKKNDCAIESEYQKQDYCSISVVNEIDQCSSEEVSIGLKNAVDTVDNMICREISSSHALCQSFFELKKKDRGTVMDTPHSTMLKTADSFSCREISATDQGIGLFGSHVSDLASHFEYESTALSTMTDSLACTALQGDTSYYESESVILEGEADEIMSFQTTSVLQTVLSTKCEENDDQIAEVSTFSTMTDGVRTASVGTETENYDNIIAGEVMKTPHNVTYSQIDAQVFSINENSCHAEIIVVNQSLQTDPQLQEVSISRKVCFEHFPAVHITCEDDSCFDEEMKMQIHFSHESSQVNIDHPFILDSSAPSQTVQTYRIDVACDTTCIMNQCDVKFKDSGLFGNTETYVVDFLTICEKPLSNVEVGSVRELALNETSKILFSDSCQATSSSQTCCEVCDFAFQYVAPHKYLQTDSLTCYETPALDEQYSDVCDSTIQRIESHAIVPLNSQTCYETRLMETSVSPEAAVKESIAFFTCDFGNESISTQTDSCQLNQLNALTWHESLVLDTGVSHQWVTQVHSINSYEVSVREIDVFQEPFVISNSTQTFCEVCDAIFQYAAPHKSEQIDSQTCYEILSVEVPISSQCAVQESTTFVSCDDDSTRSGINDSLTSYEVASVEIAASQSLPQISTASQTQYSVCEIGFQHAVPHFSAQHDSLTWHEKSTLEIGVGQEYQLRDILIGTSRMSPMCHEVADLQMDSLTCYEVASVAIATSQVLPQIETTSQTHYTVCDIGFQHLVPHLSAQHDSLTWRENTTFEIGVGQDYLSSGVSRMSQTCHDVCDPQVDSLTCYEVALVAIATSQALPQIATASQTHYNVCDIGFQHEKPQLGAQHDSLTCYENSTLEIGVGQEYLSSGVSRMSQTCHDVCDLHVDSLTFSKSSLREAVVSQVNQVQEFSTFLFSESDNISTACQNSCEQADFTLQHSALKKCVNKDLTTCFETEVVEVAVGQEDRVSSLCSAFLFSEITTKSKSSQTCPEVRSFSLQHEKPLKDLSVCHLSYASQLVHVQETWIGMEGADAELDETTGTHKKETRKYFEEVEEVETTDEIVQLGRRNSRGVSCTSADNDVFREDTDPCTSPRYFQQAFSHIETQRASDRQCRNVGVSTEHSLVASPKPSTSPNSVPPTAEYSDFSDIVHKLEALANQEKKEDDVTKESTDSLVTHSCEVTERGRLLTTTSLTTKLTKYSTVCLEDAEELQLLAEKCATLPSNVSLEDDGGVSKRSRSTDFEAERDEMSSESVWMNRDVMEADSTQGLRSMPRNALLSTTSLSGSQMVSAEGSSLSEAKSSATLNQRPLSSGTLKSAKSLSNEMNQLQLRQKVDRELLSRTLHQRIHQVCETVSHWCRDSTHISSSELNIAMERLREEWFRIALNPTTLPLLDEFIRFLKNYHPLLVQKVLNLADEKLNTALHYACGRGVWSLVADILQVPKVEVNKYNKAGYTPLMLAAYTKLEDDSSSDVVRRLLELSDVNLCAGNERGETALLLAAQKNNLRLIRGLLEYDTDVNASDKDGNTALIWAAECGFEDLVRLLLKHPHVDCSLLDANGKSAFQIAMDKQFHNIALHIYSKEQLSRSSTQRKKVSKRSSSHGASDRRPPRGGGSNIGGRGKTAK